MVICTFCKLIINHQYKQIYFSLQLFFVWKRPFWNDLLCFAISVTTTLKYALVSTDRAPPRPPLPMDSAPPRPPPPETDDEDDLNFPLPQANQPIMVSAGDSMERMRA